MHENFSLVAMLIQAFGLLLLTVLSTLLARAVPRDYSRYWAAAWAALSVALFALYGSFHVPDLLRPLQFVYFFGEYVFGLLLLAGLRNFARGRRIAPRDAWWLPPAALLSLVLARLPAGFSPRFVLQAALLSAIFAGGFRLLWPLRTGTLSGPGLRVTLTGLALLALNFAHYVPILSYAALTDSVLPLVYRGYTSIYDLLLEVLLVFGLVTLTLETGRAELERANTELREAQARLETLARHDALTEALNRHAFHALLEHQRGTRAAPGCALLIDVDNLKQINDLFGHAAGDIAIRAVAKAVRALVRPDDLVFRWGGDEFLVLLFGLSEEESRLRFMALDTLLGAVSFPGRDSPVAVHVSTGSAALGDEPLERAIERADAAMYRHKQERKVAGGIFRS